MLNRPIIRLKTILPPKRPAKKVPAWDADDWIKYKKENPSYYDEDGRSYLHH